MEKRMPSKNSQAQDSSPESLIAFKKHLSRLGRKELNLTLKKLNYLCLEFDPYEDKELSPEEKNIIEEYELSPYLGDPFSFTNILLQMLDAIEAEINSRSH